jgi:hypothetical protein
MRYFFIFLLMLTFTMALQALSLRPKSDLELAATADIIMVGVVTAVSSKPAKEDHLAGAGRSTIAVKRVIAGSPGKTLNIMFPTPPRKGGMAWGLTLAKGEQKLFFLEFAGDGYHIGSPLGVRSVDDADHFAQLKKEIPVRITLIPPGQMTVGKPVTVSIQVTNSGNKPIEYRETTMIAYASSPQKPVLAGTPFTINFSPRQPKLKPEQPGVRVEPGETKIMKTVLVPNEPNSNHPLVKTQNITCRASVWLKIIDPKVEKWPPTNENLPVIQGFYAAAPWITASLRPAEK